MVSTTTRGVLYRAPQTETRLAREASRVHESHNTDAKNHDGHGTSAPLTNPQSTRAVSAREEDTDLQR